MANITTGAKVEYTWNHANQLSAVKYKTSTNIVTKSVEYQYDALGRRIGKSVDDNGDGTVNRRESFIYDGAGLLADAAGSIHIAGPNGALNQAGWTDQMILSFTDADADGSSPALLTSRNLYGPAADQIFATEGATGTLLWSLADHQGTPRDWAMRDSSGTTIIAQQTRYTAFGTIASIETSASLPASSSPPLPSFTGQLYDDDAGLMYYRARWYDPQLGKFLNDDPMGFAAGDANVSRYVGNSPLEFSDPTGLDGLYVWTGSHAEFFYTLVVEPTSELSNVMTTSEGYELITSEPVKHGLPPGNYVVMVEYWGHGVTWEQNMSQTVTGAPGRVGVLVMPAEKYTGPELTTSGGSVNAEAVNKFVDEIALRDLKEMMEESLTKGRVAMSTIDPNADPKWHEYDLRTTCVTFAHECESVYMRPTEQFYNTLFPLLRSAN